MSHLVPTFLGVANGITKYKTEPDRWRIQVYVGRTPDGRDKRRSRIITAPHTKAGRLVAERARLDFIDELDQHQPGNEHERTVAELLDERIRIDSPSWSLQHRTLVTHWSETKIKPHIGDVRLSDLRPHDIEAMMADLAAGGLSPSSVKRTHSHTRAALNRAVDWGWIATNPAHPR